MLSIAKVIYACVNNTRSHLGECVRVLCRPGDQSLRVHPGSSTTGASYAADDFGRQRFVFPVHPWLEPAWYVIRPFEIA